MPEFPALLGLGVSGDEHNPASRIVQRANDIDGRDNASAIVITGKIMWGGRGKVSQNAAQSARWGLVPETRIDGVEKSPQELMAEARTPEELLAAINGLEGLQGSKKYYNKAELLAAANDIFTGSEVLYFATSTGGFRDAVERVGCRFFPKNMVKGGHREVFTGAHFRGNELKLLDDMIERLGPITGSDGKPIVEEKLKWFARLVVEDGITPSIATRTQGFREALTTMHEDRKKSRR